MTGLDVLIADDSEIAREALRNMVQGLGWKATAVDSGEAAVHHVATQTESRIPIEVLLLDWKMPGVDGLAAAKVIRHELKAACDPIVIMVTAYERDELLAQADCGLVDAVLNKPVTPSALYNAVSHALRLRRGGSVRTPNRPRQRLAGVRIQVVDDSEINREVAQRIFADEGAEVVLACDGRQAVDWLRGHPGGVDIVMMDVQMPGLNGYEATREIRLLPALRQLPIVALTAGVFREQRESAQSAGMNGFLSKPFDVDAAIGLIIKLTGGKAGQVAQATPVAAPFPAPFSSDLPGLAVSSGLAIWKDRASYQQYLRKFVSDYADIVDRIQRGTGSEGAALAHKLKGASSNLALEEVFACAGQAEQTLRDRKEPAAALAKLQAALATALKSIAQFAPSGSQVWKAAPGSTHQDGMATLLSQLLAACDTDSPGAVKPILAELVNVMPPASLAAIQVALENFDFRSAEAAIRRLCGTLDILPEAE
jgi:hypothetical protein